jgi:hypothetical protein
MPALAILIGLICALAPLSAMAEGNIAAIRFAHYEVLNQQYSSVANTPGAGSNNHNLRLCREFLPKFLALAKESPDDEAALRCCEWIIVHCRSHSTAGELYAAETTAWEIVANNQSEATRLPALCLEAAKSPSPARERFLRSLPADYRQPVEVHGYAFLALAELLANKAELTSDSRHLDEQAPVELRKYFAAINRVHSRQESVELFQHVLAHYADIAYIGPTGDTCKSLGERAAQGLLELKSPQLARKALPNIIEMPARRFDHFSGK